MKELWILMVTAVSAYFWTAELWMGNIWGAALVLALGFVVALGGPLAFHFKGVLWRRLVK